MRSAAFFLHSVLLACPLLCAVAANTNPDPGDDWETLAAGLEIGMFHGLESALGDGTITVLRIDPEFWEFRVLTASAIGDARERTPSAWCRDFGLNAVINAGMFDIDRMTHMGLLMHGDHVNSPVTNSYQSVAAFEPVAGGDARFRIFDVDAPDFDMEAIREGYASVVQNMRLIKRTRENRWPRKERMWSETALAEDGSGRALFIFVRTPYTMHDLNEALLALPIDLVCAQHLEGGGLAQMVVRLGDDRRVFVGSYESGGSEHDDNTREWPLPNVIGIVPRKR